ncbi:hypothetical protein SEUCBS140593_008278 [Sporothrix eucalyptigena]|uniref:Uncharacterized protein n=1 Tax=Sporothrix eucalyptigena TaxID=1812306 RepID=A0ABP0CK95_9PEZI
MSSRKKYEIYVAVHRSEPLDYQKYRHAALYFKPVGGGATMYFHVVGAALDFELQKRTSYENSATLVRLIPVGVTKNAITAEQLTSLMRNTPIKNDDYEFNCQAWVQKTLEGLAAAGHITNEEYAKGVDDMIEATMDGTDDP